MAKRTKKTDDQLKAELLALAKSGAPRPKANTELGRALKRFTTPPTMQQEQKIRRVCEIIKTAERNAPNATHTVADLMSSSVVYAARMSNEKNKAVQKKDFLRMAKDTWEVLIDANRKEH